MGLLVSMTGDSFGGGGGGLQKSLKSHICRFTVFESPVSSVWWALCGQGEGGVTGDCDDPPTPACFLGFPTQNFDPLENISNASSASSENHGKPPPPPPHFWTKPTHVFTRLIVCHGSNTKQYIMCIFALFQILSAVFYFVFCFSVQGRGKASFAAYRGHLYVPCRDERYQWIS